MPTFYTETGTVEVDAHQLRAFLIYRVAACAVVWGDPIDVSVLEYINSTDDLSGALLAVAETDYMGNVGEAVRALGEWVASEYKRAVDEGRLSPTEEIAR